ncbi:MAG: hypothetical protein CL456_10040 [Acidimicrobiaceae bacterium]|nr:hypothetical protein [Acidimicrobiaceae bacterium]
MNSLIQVLRSFPKWLQQSAPGLTLVAGATTAALWINAVTNLSAGAIALGFGLWFGNISLGSGRAQVGLTFSSRRLLRVGVVLLGFRLSISELRQSMNWLDALMVVTLVSLTLWGVGRVCKAFGLSPDFGRLLGVGYAVCGVSAIAAVKPLTKAEEEEVAYAVGVVTLFGTLSMACYPVIGAIANLAPETFGWWAGSAIHDVAQVVATATMRGDEALETAVVIKLGRVALLGPILVFVSMKTRGRANSERSAAVKAIPLFVVGFILAVVARSIEILPIGTLELLDDMRKIFLTAAMVGVGALVKLRSLVSMGRGPLNAGFISWLLLAGIAFVVSGLMT